MKSKDIQEEIIQIDWTLFSGPEYYEPDKVPEALISLILLKKEKLRDKIYNKVLFAIGNNHAGTYYPVVEVALIYIIQTALSGKTEVARNCALDMLIDLYASFSPELGSYNSITNDELEKKVATIIESAEEDLLKLSNDESESDRNKAFAIDLLDCMAENRKITTASTQT